MKGPYLANIGKNYQCFKKNKKKIKLTKIIVFSSSINQIKFGSEVSFIDLFRDDISWLSTNECFYEREHSTYDFPFKILTF